MTPRRTAPIIVIVAGIAILGGAFLFQHVGGLAPCELCVAQRYPYGVAIALGILALLLPSRAGRGILLILAALAFLTTAGIGAYHVGVEQHWWQGPTTCTGTPGTGLTLEQLRAQILAAPVVQCDKVAWSLFGISLAGYNFLLALLLAAYAAAAGIAQLRRR